MTSGKPQHWDSGCLTYAVQRDGSPARGLAAEDVAWLVGEAFEVWRSVQCEGGGSPSFNVTFQGFVGCGQRDTDCASADANVNVVMFHDHDWPESHHPLAFGATTTVGSPSSGRLIDADIELNSERYPFTWDGSFAISLRRTLLHEVGHFMGLGHSHVRGSIMAETYQYDRTEGLSFDDVRGICAIFPPSNAALTCAPSSPAYDQCKGPEACETEATTSGCGVSRAGHGALPGVLLVGIVSGAWAAIRRRRSARAAP